MSLNKYPGDITTAGIVWRCSPTSVAFFGEVFGKQMARNQQNDVPMVVLEISHCHGMSRGCHDIRLIVADCGSCVPVPTHPAHRGCAAVDLNIHERPQWYQTAFSSWYPNHMDPFSFWVGGCNLWYTPEPFAPSEMLSIRLRKTVELCGTSVSNPHDCRLFLLSGLIQFPRKRMRRYFKSQTPWDFITSDTRIQRKKLLLMWLCPKVFG